MSDNSGKMSLPAEFAAQRSRRSLLSAGAKGIAAMAFSQGMSPLARAAGYSDRALVCIQLVGGHDGNNMIVPLDDAGYSDYTRARGELALSRADLAAVTARAAGRPFGFHPALSGLRDLYQQGLLAVVANVGQLRAPATKAQLLGDASLLPGTLYSHTRTEQVSYVSGGLMSLSWAKGQEFSQERGISTSASSALAAVKLSERAHGAHTRSFPSTRVGQSLALVAGAIAEGGTGSAYLVTMAGFDTHGDLLARQNALYAQLNDALVSFHSAIRTAGLAGKVTAFTQTEFSRTLAPNAFHGADHGWGRHELVLGGAVAGGDVYGTFPSLQLGGADDLTGRGVLIPTTAEMQYTSTLARWFGIGDLSSMPAFGGLNSFSKSDLGFLAG